jgi:hypothetical protein
MLTEKREFGRKIRRTRDVMIRLALAGSILAVMIIYNPIGIPSWLAMFPTVIVFGLLLVGEIFWRRVPYQ